jgi:uncharacterized membrane protein/cytochrome c5
MNHPIHAIFVHFPAGLIPIAVLFFLIFLFTKRLIFERISITLLGFSLIFLIFTIITGLYDWYTRYMNYLFPIIIIKIFLSIIVTLVIILIWNIRNKYAKNNSISLLSKTYGYITLYFCLFPLIAVIGFFGGSLVYPSENENHGDLVRIGSKIYIKNCSACHPYGQGIYDPLIFPGSSQSFGSASILHSALMNDENELLKYIRNPKRMPKVSNEKVSDADFYYLFKYLRYLKFGNDTTVSVDSNNSGNKIFMEFCDECHDNFKLGNDKNPDLIRRTKNLRTDNAFSGFIRGLSGRKENFEMPVFDSSQISEDKIKKLYKYLITKKN